MAELLIVVVAVVVLLLYAADRARKLRVRARQMAAMNERLDVAAAKIDKEQQRKRARVRASAELTSVMPAIKRPPLKLPGIPAPWDVAEKEAAPEAVPEAAGQVGAAGYAGAAGHVGAAGHAEEAPAAGQTPAAGPPPDTEPSPAGPSPDTEPAPVPAGGAAAEPAPPAESTLSMPASGTADGPPAPDIRVTTEGTLIMPSVRASGSGARQPGPGGRDRRAGPGGAPDRYGARPPLTRNGLTAAS